MSHGIKANINPHVLTWARRSAGYALDEAAKKVRIVPEKLLAWEAGEDQPTVRQLRLLAGLYKRPTALFYCACIPDEPRIAADFRLLPAGQAGYTPRLRYELRRAFHRRAIAMELTEQLGETVVDFPLRADMSEPSDALAQRIRQTLGITLAAQSAWRDPHAALRSWTSAIERLGVFVFHVTRVELGCMRGFSITERPFPVIGLNSKDSPRGRVFTLLHELIHIVLQSGGICDLHGLELDSHGSIETYCNRVAGEVLVPREALLNEEIVLGNGDSTVWREEQLRALSNRYMTSEEVILRRLLILGRTTRDFYHQKREEYAAIHRSESTEARGAPPYHRRVLQDNGRTFSSLVLSAYLSQVISCRDLSSFLGGFRLDYLGRIEQALMGSEEGIQV